MTGDVVKPRRQGETYWGEGKEVEERGRETGRERERERERESERERERERSCSCPANK